MALINCPECGKEISDDARKCVHCGYRLKKKSARFKVLAVSIPLGAIIIGLFIWLMSAGSWSFINVGKIISTGSFGCLISHEWSDPTCQHGYLCTICGSEKGEKADHTWEAATCEHPEKCIICGEERGERLEHVWMEATCTVPKTCSLCKATEGEALGHSARIGKCTVCGEYSDELYDEYKDISNCFFKMLDCLEDIGNDLSYASLGLNNSSNYIWDAIENCREVVTWTDKAIELCGSYKEFSQVKIDFALIKEHTPVFPDVDSVSKSEVKKYFNLILQDLNETMDTLNDLLELLKGMDDLGE